MKPLIATIALLSACNNVSKYAIDDKHNYQNRPNSASAFSGFSFVRIISQSKTSMTIAKVADTTLRHLKSAKEVRYIFERNVHKPSFYKDTMHLYKINDYHARIGQAADMARGTKIKPGY